MMRSESTSALGQPSETKLTLGADAVSAAASCFSFAVSTTNFPMHQKNNPHPGGEGRAGHRWPGRSVLTVTGRQRRAHRLQGRLTALREGGLHILGLTERAHLALPVDRGIRHIGVDPELAPA